MKNKKECYDILKITIDWINELNKCPKCKSKNTNYINNHAKIICNDCGHIRKTLE